MEEELLKKILSELESITSYTSDIDKLEKIETKLGRIEELLIKQNDLLKDIANNQ